MTYKQQSMLRKRLLDLALTGEPGVYKSEMRAVFAVLEKQGYGVSGYKWRLEEALKFVTRALAAANALEGRNEPAQK